MTRRATTGGKTGKARRSRTPKPKRRTAAVGVRYRGTSDANLKEQFDQRTRELHEALEQQAATAKVLQVINSSPGDLVPVFEAILEKAHALCDVAHGGLLLCEGETFRAVALHSYSGRFAEQVRQGYRGADNPLTRSLINGDRFVHIPDLRQIDHPMVRASVDNAGIRTGLYLPLRKDGVLLGMISCCRKEIRPFSDKEIALLENFAGQAVIAIENARLLNELRQRTDALSEALEQQTATSNVLGVISRSSGALQPVFDVILANATRLCGAKFASVNLFEKDVFRFGAAYNAPPAWLEHRRRNPVLYPNPGTGLAHIVLTKQLHQIEDIKATPEYADGDPITVAAADLGGYRTLLSVPMLDENNLIGALSIFRQEVRPFTAKQIELVQNFAAQAVIAIENTRLLNELRQRTDDLSESLEQQTATSEVLKVISSSSGDLDPVFRSMLENAVRICKAKFGQMFLVEGERIRLMADLGVPLALTENTKARGTFQPISDGPLDRILRTKAIIHVADVAALFPEHPAATLGGARSFIGVPMLKEGELIGLIVIYRQEVRPFTERQIELVTNFAAQAVIAIENARLLNELRQRTDDLSESLEQQTATSEVLKVISSSQGDLQSVFEAMLVNAVRICEAKFGTLFLIEDGMVRAAALHNLPAQLAEFDRNRGKFLPARGASLDRIMRTKEHVNIIDDATEPVPSQAAKLGGARSYVGVPMLKDDELIGVIGIYRQEVRPFTAKQIGLLQNFAAQAVIAIENTRLLNELLESLAQQTATADVLKTISRSAFDLTSVLQALVESAARLCDADRTTITRQKNGQFFRAEGYGYSPDFMEYLRSVPVQQSRGSAMGRVLLENKIIHIADVLADPDYTFLEAQKLGGYRTMLGVPMLREGVPIGVMTMNRMQVRPFTKKQIDLATTFADQAAIAIENVRLFDEVQQRTEELSESLAQQTATADVLKVISRSAFDLQRVLQTLLETAVRLCGAQHGLIFRYDGESCHAVASHNTPPGYFELWERTPIRADRRTTTGRALLERRTIQITDVLADPEYDFAEAQKIMGYRTVLVVPMMRDGVPLGTIGLFMTDVSPFTDKQVALVETFADQAAIAIENVRLFDEIQDKSRELAEASQHKSQFLANMSHELRTPLNAILGYTELMADGVYGAPPEKMSAVLKRVESNGRHLLGLINAVLDLSKIEAGQLKLDLADYSLSNVVQTVHSAVEPLATDKKLTFKAEIASVLPPGQGDERRLTQVLLNLVGNAIKFTDAGEVVIKVDASDGLFALSVRDTGPGISAADQAKLFQEFQQADNSITRKKGGTGLGLAISKRIIELHGGKIWLESQVGQGSTFFVTLPVRAEEQLGPN
jgi:GAF domain-containing protein